MELQAMIVVAVSIQTSPHVFFGEEAIDAYV
jgi:hypothetical protein